jgi:hypothetical protein
MRRLLAISALVGAGVMMRRMWPEMVRYLKIRRM